MKSENSFQQVQGIFSIGYIYLIVLGIFNETVFYTQIGINYLKYSSILDVLISPLAQLTSSVTSIIISIVGLFLIFFLPPIFAEKANKNWIKKAFKLKEGMSTKEAQAAILNWIVVIVGMLLLGFFLGRGIGGGVRMNQKIADKELKYQDELTFLDGQNQTVQIIGKNSTYIFYLEPDNNTPKITPINGAIKSIKEIKD